MKWWPIWCRITLRISEIRVNFYKEGKESVRDAIRCGPSADSFGDPCKRDGRRFFVRERTLRCGIGHLYGPVMSDRRCNIKEFGKLSLANQVLPCCVQIRQEERCRL